MRRLAILGAFLVSSVAAAAPEVTVVAVGSNKSYKGSLQELRFAEDDARRFAQAMTTVGLVPLAKATVLTAPTVADLRRVLKDLRPAHGDEAGRKLVFYFSGHADEAGVHLRDGALSRRDLHEELSAIKAHTKVAIVDSCFSGAITAKGIEGAAAFELPRMEFDEPSGSVFLAAASGKQYAYESDQLKSSVFTHHLLAGLYGEADGNTDGIVTVDELYQYVYRNTKWQTMGYPTRGSQEPEIATTLRGQGAVVLSFPSQTNAKLALGAEVQGDVTIASAAGLQYFRVSKEKGNEKLLQLPAGRYRVSVARADEVGDAEVSLEPAATRRLAAGDLAWRDGGPSASKGGDGAVAGELTASGSDSTRYWTFAVGAHFGYGGGQEVGPFAEGGLGTVLRQGPTRIRAEAAVGFHRHDADIAWADGEVLRTDSFALYAMAVPEFRAAGLTIEPRVGVGQTFHDQRTTSTDGAAVVDVAQIPAMMVGLGVGFGDYSVGYRYEALQSAEVEQNGQNVVGQMLVIGASF